MNEETFGQRLRKLIKRAKLSQQNVADELDIPRNTVWRWINEQATPESNNLQKLATLLHVSVDDLLNGVPTEQQTWVLHVEVGERKENYINMATLAVNPISVITTGSDAGFLQLGGSYELWTDDKLFKKMIEDFKKLRSAVIANGRAQGGIKDEGEKKK